MVSETERTEQLPAKVVSSQLELYSGPTSSLFHYPATLDPWRRYTDTEASWLLKLIALTSPHTVLSDNQAINSLGLQRLLKRDDVRQFLRTVDPVTGHFPILIALRAGARDFEDVLLELVVNRERPAILPWMTPDQQVRLEAAYSTGNRATLGPLFDIAGDDFVTHISFLNSLLTHRHSALISWQGLKERYPLLVRASISAFTERLRDRECNFPSAETVPRICDTLLSFLESPGEANRSNLYRIIQSFPVDSHVKTALELKLLTEPYHANIAEACGFHQITGPEYRHTPFPQLFARIARAARSLRPTESHELDQFPLDFDQIPFSRITEIRHSPSFHPLLKHIYDPGEPRASYLRDFLDLLRSEMAREPKGLHKLGKLRIHLFITPERLQDDLREAGITLADILGAASRGLGLLIGETVGQLVGVFGIGGLSGVSAALVVERIAEDVYSAPKRAHDFQQLVQLLREPAGQVRHLNEVPSRPELRAEAGGS